MSEPTTFCQPHGQPEPCAACALAAQHDGDLLTPPSTPEPFHPLTAAFLKYHAGNPHVLEAIRAEARTLYVAGVRRCGIATLFEVVRWRLTLNEYADQARTPERTPAGRMVSMSNSHSPYYARLLAHLHPEHLGTFFKARPSEADNRTDEWLAAAVAITKGNAR